jgi:hypothetical protein
MLADEGRHRVPADDPGWREVWWFDAWTRDGSLAVGCRLTLVPAARRAWYWCHVVRRGEPLLQVVELEAPLPAAGLTIRTHGLWADHVCEAPFEQWTVANEAHGVALDDPDEALGRAYGDAEPVAVDLEWYATASPFSIAAGYEQAGEAHGVLEMRSGAVHIAGPALRGHEWGTGIGYAPRPARAPDGLRAPLALPDGNVLEQVATPLGWTRWIRAPHELT